MGNLQYKINKAFHVLLALKGNDLNYLIGVAQIYDDEINKEEWNKYQEAYEKMFTEFKERMKKAKKWWSEKKIWKIRHDIYHKYKPGV